MDRAAPEGDIAHSAGLLRALRALEIVRLRLTATGHAPPLDQILRAQTLLRTLARSGVDLETDRSALARYLAPILATSRESERLLRGELNEAERLLDEPARERPGTVSEGLQEIGRSARLARYRRIGLAAGLLILLLAAVTWLVRMSLHTPAATVLTPGPSGPVAPAVDPETFAVAILGRVVAPGVLALFPFLAGIVWLLRSGPSRRSALQRTSARGRLVETLRVPPARTAIFSERGIAPTLANLRRPLLLQGSNLDTGATIRETIRTGGSLELRWQVEPRAFEYVLLCERGAPSDHMGMIAEALRRRLTAARVSFTRYDLDAGAEVVRFAGGRRSGPPVEPLAQVRRRHSGARLILLGSAEGLLRRFERPGGRQALAELLAAFEAPFLLTTAPAERWGWREARLSDLGVAVFEADARGLEKAVAHVTAAETEPAPLPRIPEGEDPLLGSLHREGLRYLSDVAPDEAEVALLVRRLRSFLADVEGFPLLAATAAFPRIEPDLTARMAELVNNRPLDARLAGRFASLPWMKTGRMPDWLRLAILRQLPRDRRQDIRAALMLMLDDLRAVADDEKIPPNSTARLEILSREGVLDKLLGTLGMGERPRSAEAIFIRFLEGEELDELDQPDSRERAALNPARRAAVAGLAAAGLGSVWAAFAFLTPRVGIGIDDDGLWLLLPTGLGYVLLCWILVQLVMAGPRKGLNRLALALHPILYCAGALWSLLGMFDPYMPVILPPFLILLASLHLILHLDAPGPHLRPRQVPLPALRFALITLGPALGLAALPEITTDLGQTGTWAAFFAIPVAMLLVLLAYTEVPTRYSAIVRNFAHAVTVSLSAWALSIAGSIGGFTALQVFDATATTSGHVPAPLFRISIFWIAGFLAIGHIIDRRFARASRAFAVIATLLIVAALFVDLWSVVLAIGFCIILAGATSASSYFVDKEPLPSSAWLNRVGSKLLKWSTAVFRGPADGRPPLGRGRAS